MNETSPIKKIVKLNDYFYEVHCAGGFIAEISVTNNVILIENDKFLSKRMERLIEISVRNYGK